AIRLRGVRRDEVHALLALDPEAAAVASGRAGDLASLVAAAAGPPAPGRPVMLLAQGAGGSPLGYVVLQPGGFFGRDYVARVGVAATVRRGGLGRTLLRAAVATARTPRVFTSVNAANQPMRALLTDGGWTPAGALDGVNADLAPGRADLELVSYLDTPHPTGPVTRLVHHLALARDWEAARSAGTYRVSTLGRTLDQVGFVHACLAGPQLSGVAERFYAGVSEPLVLLTLDRDRLRAPVLVEPVHGAGSGPQGLFPHVYGPVEVDAVVAVRAMARDASGRWHLP
ncbi:MAG TPA: GNAT family N-acetyltransferase, partial [Kineosporiaceae bacterium]|nr:GNAT family N-acetyltransferase [Kineosporiaceae bacterium]